MKQTLKLLAISALMLGGFALVKAPSVHAASLTVNSTADTTNQDDGSCTLREAINNVNAGSDTTDGGLGGDCAAADGNNDKVVLPAGVIALSASLPSINESISIEGQGIDQTTITGNSLYGGIISTNGSLSIKKLTLTAMLDMGVLSSGGGDVVYEEIEVDGTGWQATDPSGVVAGVVVGGEPTSDITVRIRNVYIHSFNVNASQAFLTGVVAGGSADTHAVIENVTLVNNTNTGLLHSLVVGAGLFDGGSASGRVSGEVSNITVDGSTSTNSTVTGLIVPVINEGETSANVEVSNITIVNLRAGGTSPFLGGGAGAAIGVAAGADISAIANITVRNALVAGNEVEGCATIDISAVLGSSGTSTATITSEGGNLIDDTSCSPYFTQTTDQNNIGALESTLETLADNGGFIPTIALKKGSPAVDSGVVVAGLTQDARLAARPQGSAFDSGAYESAFTRPTENHTLAPTGEGALAYSMLSVALITGGLAVFVVKFKT